MGAQILANTIADPETRDRVGRAVLDAIGNRAEPWEVSIFEPKDPPAWAVSLKGPNEFTRSYKFSGPLEQRPEFVNASVIRAISDGTLQASISDPILERFRLLSGTSDGIETWLTRDTNPEIFKRFSKIDKEPLSKVQLDQLLVLGHEAGVSDGFFEYFWLTVPSTHPYDVRRIPGFVSDFAVGTVSTP